MSGSKKMYDYYGKCIAEGFARGIKDENPEYLSIAEGLARGIKDENPEYLKPLYKTDDEEDEERETPFSWPKENPFIKKGEGAKMTKTEAQALEDLCDRTISKALEEKAHVSYTLSGRLKISFGDNSITLNTDLKTIFYINFNGFYGDLLEHIEKIIKWAAENETKIKLLIWSYDNRRELEDDE